MSYINSINLNIFFLGILTSKLLIKDLEHNSIKILWINPVKKLMQVMLDIWLLCKYGKKNLQDSLETKTISGSLRNLSFIIFLIKLEKLY